MLNIEEGESIPQLEPLIKWFGLRALVGIALGMLHLIPILVRAQAKHREAVSQLESRRLGQFI